MPSTLKMPSPLHDLVAHGLAIVSVQAWGAKAALATERRPREALAAIREAAGSIAERARPGCR